MGAEVLLVAPDFNCIEIIFLFFKSYLKSQAAKYFVFRASLPYSILAAESLKCYNSYIWPQMPKSQSRKPGGKNVRDEREAGAFGCCKEKH